jgi:hypothetical protein
LSPRHQHSNMSSAFMHNPMVYAQHYEVSQTMAFKALRFFIRMIPKIRAFQEIADTYTRLKTRLKTIPSITFLLYENSAIS